MNDFWRNTRAIVTGGAGFLGSHLVPLLREAGASVYVPRSHEYDLRKQADADAMLRYACVDDMPNVVFHLAANVGGIAATAAHPAQSFYDNATMGINLIHAACHAGVDKLVTAGSVCAYPKHAPVPTSESNLWRGYPEETNAPYGVAKRMLHTMLDAYRQEYDFSGVYLLLANLFGERDSFDPETSHVIPALIRKCVEARDSGADSITVWGTGKASRDFLYAGDAARALMLAAERYDSGEPVNVGSGEETPIAGLVQLICKATGYDGDVVYDTSRPDGQPRRCFRIWRAERELGWQPEVSLAEGLRRTVNYWEDVKVHDSDN